MAAKMSSRQRYLTTFKHEEPDRVPIFLDTGPICFYTDKIRWESQLQQAEILLEAGCDPMINIWYPTPVPNPDVEIKTWREKKADGKVYIGKEFHTPKGVLRQVVNETSDWCNPEHGLWVQYTLGTGLRKSFGMEVFDDWNVPRRTESWVKGPEDLEKLPYILQKPAQWQLDEWRHDAERVMEFAKEHDLLTMVRRTIVSDASQWFCDIPWFMMQLYDDPGFVEQFFAIFEEVSNWQVELALPLKPDVIQHRGWYDGPEFWGGHFDKYIAPVINRQADMAHQADVLHCYLQTDRWGPYVDSYKNLKSDILWGANPVADKAVLKTIKKELGKKKTLLGGICCEQHLALGDEQTARQATTEAIKTLAPGGGFILASASSIWEEAKWENMSAMIDQAHKVGQYPIK